MGTKRTSTVERDTRQARRSFRQWRGERVYARFCRRLDRYMFEARLVIVHSQHSNHPIMQRSFTVPLGQLRYEVAATYAVTRVPAGSRIKMMGTAVSSATKRRGIYIVLELMPPDRLI